MQLFPLKKPLLDDVVFRVEDVVDLRKEMQELELVTRRKFREGRLVHQAPEVDLSENGVGRVDVDGTLVGHLKTNMTF